MKSQEEVVKEMQEVAEQMVLDDLAEDPTLAEKTFECDCCGQMKQLAGSIEYNGYRLCNDCVVIAETGFALKKFNTIEKLINAMEDTRLENLCNFIKQDEKSHNN